jgi:hypothetical protein
MSEDIRKMIDKIKNWEQFLNENISNTITVYHGTIPKFVNSIRENGLEDNTSTPYIQGWYMVSTDFESALFHANTDDKKDFVYVFEFQIPIIENDRWVGYPYLWKGSKMNDNSTWFALMKKIPKKFIKKLHKISYNEWIFQKNRGF